MGVGEEGGGNGLERGVDLVGEFADAEIGVLAGAQADDVPRRPGVERDHAVAGAATGQEATRRFLHPLPLERALVAF